MSRRGRSLIPGHGMGKECVQQVSLNTGTLASLNRSWQSNKGTFHASENRLRWQESNPCRPNQVFDWTPLSPEPLAVHWTQQLVTHVKNSDIRHRGRAVKAADSKSAGVSPREFESHRCRKFVVFVSRQDVIEYVQFCFSSWWWSDFFFFAAHKLCKLLRSLCFVAKCFVKHLCFSTDSLFLFLVRGPSFFFSLVLPASSVSGILPVVLVIPHKQFFKLHWLTTFVHSFSWAHLTSEEQSKPVCVVSERYALCIGWVSKQNSWFLIFTQNLYQNLLHDLQASKLL